MANFNTNRYPWPTVDHDGANAQTGGNTRLLFAEQDNYRTRKGNPSSALQSSTESSAFSFADSNSLFYGVYADDQDAQNGIDADLNEDVYYYDQELNTFRRYDSTMSVFEDIGTTNPVLTAQSITINLVFDSGNNVEYAGAADASDQLDSNADLDAENTYYIYYNTGDSTVHKITAFTEAQTSTGTGDIFYVIPRVVSADIAETTENIPIEFLKGSLSANKAQAGAQTYGNGFSIAASEEGLHLFLRTLCNSLDENIEVKTRKGSDADGEVSSPRRDVLPESVIHVDDESIKSVHSTDVDFANDIDDERIASLSVMPKDIDENAVVELQIDGYDHSGEEIREIMLLTSDDNDQTVQTDFYFAKPPSNKVTKYKVNQAAISGSVTIESVDNWSEITFTQQDSILLPGWTLEVRKGTIPFTYVGVSPNEASIALSRDTALQIDMTVIAFDSLPYTDMGGKKVNIDTGEGSQGIDIVDNQARGDLDFVDASETLFTGWQAYLDIVEPGTASPIRVPLTDATFSINHQLDQAQLIVGDRRPGPAFRGTLRDVMLDGTILFTRERDWVRLFRNNVDFKNPIVVLRNAAAGGFPYELHIELGLGQLMSSPDPQVSDLGLITQAFNMKFRETESGESDDFSFKIVTDKWVFSEDNDTLGGLRVDGVYK